MAKRKCIFLVLLAPLFWAALIPLAMSEEQIENLQDLQPKILELKRALAELQASMPAPVRTPVTPTRRAETAGAPEDDPHINSVPLARSAALSTDLPVRDTRELVAIPSRAAPVSFSCAGCSIGVPTPEPSASPSLTLTPASYAQELRRTAGTGGPGTLRELANRMDSVVRGAQLMEGATAIGVALTAQNASGSTAISSVGHAAQVGGVGTAVLTQQTGRIAELAGHGEQQSATLLQAGRSLAADASMLSRLQRVRVAFASLRVSARVSQEKLGANQGRYAAVSKHSQENSGNMRGALRNEGEGGAGGAPGPISMGSLDAGSAGALALAGSGSEMAGNGDGGAFLSVGAAEHGAGPIARGGLSLESSQDKGEAASGGASRSKKSYGKDPLTDLSLDDSTASSATAMNLERAPRAEEAGRGILDFLGGKKGSTELDRSLAGTDTNALPEEAVLVGSELDLFEVVGRKIRANKYTRGPRP